MKASGTTYQKLTLIAWQVFALELDECSSSSARATTQGPTPTHPSLAPSPIPLLGTSLGHRRPSSTRILGPKVPPPPCLPPFPFPSKNRLTQCLLAGLAVDTFSTGLDAPLSEMPLLVGGSGGVVTLARLLCIATFCHAYRDCQDGVIVVSIGRPA